MRRNQSFAVKSNTHNLNAVSVATVVVVVVVRGAFA